MPLFGDCRLVVTVGVWICGIAMVWNTEEYSKDVVIIVVLEVFT